MMTEDPNPKTPDQGTAKALTSAAEALRLLPIAALGPVLQVRFPVANTRRDIPHGLTVVPDAYLVLLQSGGVISATDVQLWTPEVAWLMASAANTTAILVFVRLREGVIQHVAPS